jgi:hypothetical protein
MYKKILAFWRRPHSFHEAESSADFWVCGASLLSRVDKFVYLPYSDRLASWWAFVLWEQFVLALDCSSSLLFSLTRSTTSPVGKTRTLDKDLYSFWSRQLYDPLLPCWLFTDSLSPSAVYGACHIPFCPPNCSKSLWRTQVRSTSERDHKRLIFVSDIEQVWPRLIGCLIAVTLLARTVVR